MKQMSGSKVIAILRSDTTRDKLAHRWSAKNVEKKRDVRWKS